MRLGPEAFYVGRACFGCDERVARASPSLKIPVVRAEPATRSVGVLGADAEG
jgi:hypothetical protein